MPDHDLFLSYHRPDTDAVDELQRLLEEGCDAFAGT